MKRQALINSSRVALLACLVSPLLACDFLPCLPGLPVNNENATATYRLDFVSTWSASTHPTDIPDNPHFSPLIVVTHGDAVEFWSPGGIATPGIEMMAERGNNTQLREEMQIAIDSGSAAVIAESSGSADSPGSQSVTFDVSGAHSQVSAVSMIAPSPDWFVGVHGFELYGPCGWIDELVVQLQPYDAGTDSGTSYTASNLDTEPAELIQELTGAPFVTDGKIPPLGTFTFTRIDGE